MTLDPQVFWYKLKHDSFERRFEKGIAVALCYVLAFRTALKYAASFQKLFFFYTYIPRAVAAIVVLLVPRQWSLAVL